MARLLYGVQNLSFRTLFYRYTIDIMNTTFIIMLFKVVNISSESHSLQDSNAECGKGRDPLIKSQRVRTTEFDMQVGGSFIGC